MEKFVPFVSFMLVAFLLLPGCKDAGAIIEREQSEKAEIEQLARELQAWDKEDFLASGLALEGDPTKLPVGAFYKGVVSGMGVLVDIRTPKEFQQAHIPNATSIDFYGENFKEEFSKIEKSKPVFIYCRTGVRSAKATRVLTEMGFQVYNLEKGFKEWIQYDLPYVGEMNYAMGEEGC